MPSDPNERPMSSETPRDIPTAIDNVLRRWQMWARLAVAHIPSAAPMVREQYDALLVDTEIVRRAAPQEARGDEWVKEHGRLLDALETVCAQGGGARIKATRAALDAHVLAAARPAPETHPGVDSDGHCTRCGLVAADFETCPPGFAPETEREPDGWVVDAPESLPSHVAQRVVYWGPDAKRRANNRVQRMAEVFRAFAVANPVYLGAPAPADGPCHPDGPWAEGWAERATEATENPEFLRCPARHEGVQCSRTWKHTGDHIGPGAVEWPAKATERSES